MDGLQNKPLVRLFNVKYSPNLGDGLLSECLEAALIDCGADADSWSIDLAARTGYSTGSENRSMKLRVLEALPQAIRPLAVRLPLALAARKSWRPHYEAGLAGGDCVVIGGGNLLADLDLNFPTKLALAIHAAARRGLPVFIYGCGVSSGWSARGTALLDGALATGAVRRVFVRDERSQAIWDELFGRRFNLPAGIVRDPGLLASEVYAPPPPASSAPVGINITSQLALAYHSEDAPTAEALDSWYLALSENVLAKGHSLALFTNGSPEDRATLTALRPRIAALAGAERVSFPEAADPAGLVAIIAGLGGLAAFRMHAIIAAFSCGVPVLALAWDPKLTSFVQSVGQGDWLCRVTDRDGAAAAALLQEAIASGIAPDARQQVIAEARHGVGALFQAIEEALG
jgi:polysaccharide pyruvyl transferase WcaK-like protein